MNGLDEERVEKIEFDLEDEYENARRKSGVVPMGSLPQKIAFFTSIAVIVGCIGVNAVVILGANKGEEVFSPVNVPDIVVDTPDDAPLPELPPADLPLVTEPIWSERDGFSIERNEHFTGWLDLTGGSANIDLPVMSVTPEWYAETGAKRNYYLNRTFDRSGGSDRGTLYVDDNSPIRDSRRPDNTVIYGHNLSSLTMTPPFPGNPMFAYISRYYYASTFETSYRDNPTFNFTTVYTPEDDPSNTYLIFAGAFMNVNSKDGSVFDYHRRHYFDNNGRWGNAKDEFYDFVGNVMDRSIFVTDVDIEYGDEFVTLSTCLYPLTRKVNSRFALFGRRIRPGEDLSKIDFDAARLNSSPLYFDAWYRQKGGSWQGRGWDTDKVSGFDEWLEQNPTWSSTKPKPKK